MTTSIGVRFLIEVILIYGTWSGSYWSDFELKTCCFRLQGLGNFHESKTVSDKIAVIRLLHSAELHLVFAEFQSEILDIDEKL